MKNDINFLSSIILQDLQSITNTQLNWIKFKNKSFLITGASGMIMSYIVYSLYKLNLAPFMLNIKIIVVSRNEKQLITKYGNLTQNIKFIIDDVCNITNIEDSIDYIIHGASIAQTSFFNKTPVDVIQPNIISTNNLLKIAISKKVSGFMFVSSCAIYGKNTKHKLKQNDFGYIDFIKTQNSYAQSKRMGQLLCLSYYKQYNVPIYIIRLAHTFGPTMNIQKDQRIFAKFVYNILYKKPLQINNNELRFFCYIVDAVSAVYTILLKSNPGQIYNVVNQNNSLYVIDLAKELKKIYTDITIVYNNKKLIQAKPIKFSSYKIIHNLKFQFKYNIQQSFSRVISHFKQKKTFEE